MAYTLCRVRTIQISQVSGADGHNTREILSDNIKPYLDEHTGEVHPHSHGYYGSNHHYSPHSDDGEEVGRAEDILNARLEELGIQARKNSAVLEYVLGVSKDFHEKADYSVGAVLDRGLQFVGKKHGWENIVKASYHYDEVNPHIHIIVLPIVEKEVRWKNSRGEGKKVEKRLCADDFIGGKGEGNKRLVKHKLRQLQQDYFDHMWPLSRNGAVLYRGTLSEKQTREYTEKTNHLIQAIRNDLSTLYGVSLEERLREVAESQKEAEKAEKKANYRKEQNQGDGWKKGFEPFQDTAQTPKVSENEKKGAKTGIEISSPTPQPKKAIGKDKGFEMGM